jgi:uncharacterized lipoprotein YehR (DUF1307 family)
LLDFLVNPLIKEEFTMGKSVVAFLKGIVLVMTVLVLVVGVSGCQKQEGPMEKVGKSVDEGVSNTKGTMETAGEKVDKGFEETKDATKHAGEEVKEGAEKTVDAVKDTTK